jgi:hypothetical protein
MKQTQINARRSIFEFAERSGLDRGLEVSVLFTTTRATLSALRMAGRLADDLGARIRIIVPQVVPFPLELTRPPVGPDFTARRVRTIVAEHAVETEIEICLCREKVDAALSALKPNSLVVVGGRKRFWRTEETRLAELIRRQGHQVVFIDQE